MTLRRMLTPGTGVYTPCDPGWLPCSKARPLAERMRKKSPLACQLWSVAGVIATPAATTSNAARPASRVRREDCQNSHTATTGTSRSAAASARHISPSTTNTPTNVATGAFPKSITAS